jgi:hypothetical protein
MTVVTIERNRSGDAEARCSCKKRSGSDTAPCGHRVRSFEKDCERSSRRSRPGRPTRLCRARYRPGRATTSASSEFCERGERSVQFSGQELSSARPERPIFVIVLGQRDDQISRVETAVASQPLGQQRVKSLLLLAGAPAADHVDARALRTPPPWRRALVSSSALISPGCRPSTTSNYSSGMASPFGV